MPTCPPRPCPLGAAHLCWSGVLGGLHLRVCGFGQRREGASGRERGGAGCVACGGAPSVGGRAPSLPGAQGLVEGGSTHLLAVGAEISVLPQKGFSPRVVQGWGCRLAPWFPVPGCT